MKVVIQENRNPKTGKPITVITGITHNPQVIEILTKKLKNSCGAGGYITGKTITIQGSHSKKISGILQEDGYSITS